MRLSFGDHVFDSDTREVLRAGQRVAISPKAFVLLELLIERRPKAVSKSDIHARLWPDDPRFRGEPRQPRRRAALGARGRGAPAPRDSDRRAVRLRVPSRRSRPRRDRGVRARVVCRRCTASSGAGARSRSSRETTSSAGTVRPWSGSTTNPCRADTLGSRSEKRAPRSKTSAARTARTSASRRSGPRCPWRIAPSSRIGPATLTLRVLKRTGSTRSTVKERSPK